MAKPVPMEVPIFAEVAGKRIEIGVLTVECKVSPSGRITTPPPREIVRALRRVH